MVRLADAGAGAIGSWGDRGLIAADVGGLFRVSADGGTPERIPVGTLGPGEQITLPEPLPGGRAVLYEVYVRPYPRTDSGRWKVSTQGGRQPLWSRDGRELFFRDFGGAVMAVPVAPGPRFAHGPPVTLLPPSRTYTGGGATQSARTYDVSLDGTRFLMIKESAASLRPSLVVVENWFEELKRLVH